MSRLFDVANVIDSDDWYTPSWLLNGLGIEFSMDVAAPDRRTHVQCVTSLTVADDGLLTPWEGVVWCNPPYSNPAPWCRKWANHTPGGCLLIRSDLSTSGPFVAFTAAHAMYVPPKRLQFFSGAGKPTGAANFSTVLLGRGEDAVAGMLRLSDVFAGTTRILQQAAA